MPEQKPDQLVNILGVWWPSSWVNEAKAHRNIRAARDARTALPWCKEQRGLIQAGGHVGLWARTLCGEFEQVVTVEPERHNLACLRRNIGNLRNIQIVEGLLGSAEGEGTLLFNGKNGGGHKCNYEPGGWPVRTIDAIMCSHPEQMPIDLLILDIEGAELPALRGAVETIERDRPVIHLEERQHCELHGYTLDDLHDWLDDRGYREVTRIHSDVIYASAHQP